MLTEKGVENRLKVQHLILVDPDSKSHTEAPQRYSVDLVDDQACVETKVARPPGEQPMTVFVKLPAPLKCLPLTI